jgi:hypothetical protein
MIVRKSLNILPGNTTTDELWKGYHSTTISKVELGDDRSIGVKNYKGIIKLALGIIYFLSFISALTLLLI